MDRQPGAPGAADLVEALLSVGRVMVGLTARCLAAVDPDVSEPQFRALALLATGGPQRAADISAELRISPSTATRMCDRLVRKGLVRRSRVGGDRRVVRPTLTPAGRALVDEVGRCRREQLARIVAGIPDTDHTGLVEALRAFIHAART